MLPTVDVRVLIAENDDTVAGMLQRSLEDQGHSVERFTNGRDALRAIQEFAFDVALLGLDLPDIDGLEVLRRARQDPFPPECIIFASHATINTAVAAMRAGAHDYLEPPYRPEEIDRVVRRAAEAKRMRFDNARMRRRLFGRPSLPAPESAARSMQTALLAAERAAQSMGSVLIVGEPGTGKSSIARYLHDVSSRAQGPMVKVKCGRLDRSRALAALFSTSVTAAESKASDGPRTVGAFEEAAGGTVVLCDVEWMDDPSQAALAAALASGFFRREGARAQLPVEALAPRDVIDAKHLLLPAHASVERAAPQDESLDAVEWQHIQVVLERTGGHQGRAAERLGISAKTLYRKIREYGVPRDES
ncbi:sigma-54-dependent Fis family transcriptional regulator, partial [bacterium]|nr:sigma-54-dependent Fis family transcriptional regulator [bacterium]